MAKNIMVSDEVYARLRTRKRSDESLSDLLWRLLNHEKTSLLDLAGTWPFSREVTLELERSIEDTWQSGRQQ